jgi:hypothetical protein
MRNDKSRRARWANRTEAGQYNGHAIGARVVAASSNQFLVSTSTMPAISAWRMNNSSNQHYGHLLCKPSSLCEGQYMKETEREACGRIMAERIFRIPKKYSRAVQHLRRNSK